MSASPDPNSPRSTEASTVSSAEPLTSQSASFAHPALAASYRLPSVMIAIAIPTGFIQPWVSLIILLLGLFLLFQTTVIRLVFEAEALVVYRNQTVLRRFPYQDWQSWAMFWSPVPILFYFREVNSIHFLPILFSPRELRQRLEAHLPGLEKAAPVVKTSQD